MSISKNDDEHEDYERLIEFNLMMLKMKPNKTRENDLKK